MSGPTILALLAIALGFVLERRQLIPAFLKAWLALALIRLFYPCLIFAALLLRLNAAALEHLWVLPCLMALTLLLGLLIGLGLEKKLAFADDGTRRSFRFLCLLPNYSYLPLMVAQALWADAGITLVALAGVGADLVLWTIGVPQIAARARLDLRRLLLNPPLIALVLALMLLLEPFARLRHQLQIPLEIMQAIGRATIPVSMLLLGAHLGRRTRSGKDKKAHALLLGLRLGVIPALLLLLCYLLPHLLEPSARRVLILIGSMPGAILAVVLSDIYAADADFAARHILVGHLLWLITGPAWLLLEQWLFLS